MDCRFPLNRLWTACSTPQRLPMPRLPSPASPRYPQLYPFLLELGTLVLDCRFPLNRLWTACSTPQCLPLPWRPSPASPRYPQLYPFLLELGTLVMDCRPPLREWRPLRMFLSTHADSQRFAIAAHGRHQARESSLRRSRVPFRRRVLLRSLRQGVGVGFPKPA